MSDTKLTDLTATSGALDGADKMYIVQLSDGLSKKTTVSDLQNYMNGALNFARLAGDNIFQGHEYFSNNSFFAPTPETDTVVQIGGDNSADAILEMDGVGGVPKVIFKRLNGSMFPGSQTKVLSGDQLGGLETLGYQETTPGFSGPNAALKFLATQNYTSSALGSKLTFSTTPNGSTTLTTALTLDQDQSATFAGSLSTGSTISSGSSISATTSIAAGTALQAGASSAIQWAGRGILSSTAAGSIQLGTADINGSPVSQTLRAQSAVTGTDLNAADWNIQASLPTGAGTQGNIVVKTASFGNASGSSQTAAAAVATFGPSAMNATGTPTYVPALLVQQTWNNSGVVPLGVLIVNAINTASGSSPRIFTCQANGVEVFSVRTNSVSTSVGIGTGGSVTLTSLTTQFAIRNGLTIFTSPATATWQLGVADTNGTPVAQFIRSQGSVTGTDKPAGNLTITAGQGTGAGTVGSITLSSALVGTTGTTAQTQATGLTIQAGTAVLTNYTVATLPTAANGAVTGSTAFVTDASTTVILGLGTTVVGGGANKVPVYFDGTNWIIG